MLKMTHEEWLAEAKKRFGDDPKDWVFICPACKTNQTIQDFLQVGVDKKDINEVVGFDCIGRFNGNMKPANPSENKGCDWSLNGLLRIHEVEVLTASGTMPVFAFADKPGPVEAEATS